MSLLDRLFAIGSVRKALWAWWYPFLTKRLQAEDVVFLNYAYQTSPAMDLALEPADEPNRAHIQLYHALAALGNLTGKRVLEVSCGHGGGASYLTRTFNPASYLGVDLNPVGISFCQQRHVLPSLKFQVGDAQALPLEAGSVDVVLNVEASHCYPSLPQFFAEVERVLSPGGTFLYTDFRFAEDTPAWESALASAPFKLEFQRDISNEVLLGMAANAARSEALVKKYLPKFLSRIGHDFAGIPGSRVYEALRTGALSYRQYVFKKN
jgi:ubiquinone/menaquinone biosynthesis C-methylase UbiE